METIIYNQKGQESGKIKLPESIFGLTWNADLVHQVVVAMQSSARTNVAHTKTRGEVRGGGKKPWQQKGTGRARHGSTRSPIWVGGGVAHGPRKDKNFDRKVNKKAKTKALFTILSRKMRDGEILFVDTLSFAAPKTAEAKVVLGNFAKIKGFEKLGTKPKNVALLAVDSKEANVVKSFQNFGNLEISDLRSVNPVSVLNHKYLIITNPKVAFTTLESKIK
ncbi:MAG: 50S ribosomal protein L4 [Candidatus Taylorbacteria bacterium]|nr:50S ribosomal protein L4 [Candidatus Taylorbacteria bacterium]